MGLTGGFTLTRLRARPRPRAAFTLPLDDWSRPDARQTSGTVNVALAGEEHFVAGKRARDTGRPGDPDCRCWRSRHNNHRCCGNRLWGGGARGDGKPVRARKRERAATARDSDRRAGDDDRPQDAHLARSRLSEASTTSNNPTASQARLRLPALIRLITPASSS